MVDLGNNEEESTYTDFENSLPFSELILTPHTKISEQFEALYEL